MRTNYLKIIAKAINCYFAIEYNRMWKNSLFNKSMPSDSGLHLIVQCLQNLPNCLLFLNFILENY